MLILLFIYSDKITKEFTIRWLFKDDDSKPFKQAKEVLEKYGLTSYNLDKNPNYKPLLDSIDNHAEKGNESNSLPSFSNHDNPDDSDRLGNDSSEGEEFHNSLQNIIMDPPIKIYCSDDPPLEDSSELTDIEHSNLYDHDKKIELDKPTPANMLEIPVVFGEISSMPSTFRLEDTTARSQNMPKLEQEIPDQLPFIINHSRQTI
ncbi:unnamed protein product [Blepharisma stoltei]|uniref:Uncharacterized protein n=1 Tax=Blepharisma stoltei TaxID=1481888 RepID=A0AAU9JB68_9CILI|nr:unnamed protein product [Blepharisma stoltei]